MYIVHNMYYINNKISIKIIYLNNVFNYFKKSSAYINTSCDIIQ